MKAVVQWFSSLSLTSALPHRFHGEHGSSAEELHGLLQAPCAQRACCVWKGRGCERANKHLSTVTAEAFLKYICSWWVFVFVF